MLDRQGKDGRMNPRRPGRRSPARNRGARRNQDAQGNYGPRNHYAGTQRRRAPRVQQQEPISISEALKIYLVALVATPTLMFLLILFASVIGPYLTVVAMVIAIASLAIYPAVGFILNRKILTRLVCWHPYASIDQVARDKGHYMLLWPFAYPMLFIRLAGSRF